VALTKEPIVLNCPEQASTLEEFLCFDGKKVGRRGPQPRKRQSGRRAAEELGMVQGEQHQQHKGKSKPETRKASEAT